MKLELWALLYVVVGVALTITATRRQVISTPLDQALVVIAWPLYAPSVLQPSRAVGAAQPDVARLAAAIAAIDDPVWRPLLPSPTELATLATRLDELRRRADEIDAVIAADPSATERLAALATDARRERTQLVDVVASLRVEVTAIRFTAGGPDDVRCRVEDLLARLRDAQAGLAPRA